MFQQYLSYRMAKSVELHITSDPELLTILRAMISRVCQLAGFSQRENSKIVLAVDEACTNIIRHTYKGAKNRPIVIHCKINVAGIEISIVDRGQPANVKEIKPRKLEDIRPGGLGVHLIRSVMDKVEYIPGPRVGNRLYMSKALPKRTQK
jgi:anti-sigma regulatory factor (Ser/Thr protein kinase)